MATKTTKTQKRGIVPHLLQRHPLSGQYPDITGWAWEQFVANLQQHGLGERKITLHEGKVLDGWQLLRACLESKIEPAFRRLPKGVDPEQFVVQSNECRRHESPEQLQYRARERRERVAEAKRAGKSTRTIAKQEGVDERTIRDDLKKQGAGPPAPQTPDSQGNEGVEAPKTTPKAAPKATPPLSKGDAWEGDTPEEQAADRARGKNGREAFDLRAFNLDLGNALKRLDQLFVALLMTDRWGRPAGVEYSGLDRLFKEIMDKVKELNKKLRSM